MVDLSLPELAVIAVVALLVLGPNRLPGAARTAGALVRRMQRSWAGLRADIERELAADELKRELRQSAQELDVDALRDDLARTRRRIENDLSPSRDDSAPPAGDAAPSDTTTDPASDGRS
jgi:sec-independent protein translocase protein TatB